MLTHGSWTAVPGLRHGFLDRRECAGAADWGEVVEAAGVALPIVTARQVHSARVVTAVPGAAPAEADGLAVAAPSLLAGVVTADCVPVLLVSPARRVAAAVHAGWRGTAAGILEAALGFLRVEFGAEPETLEAAIGPAIGGCCYEVGGEVLAAFRAHAGDATAPAWTVHHGRHHVDLRTAARLLLATAGITRTTVLGPCTACGAGYASYRRDGAAAGRQLSFIGWA